MVRALNTESNAPVDGLAPPALRSAQRHYDRAVNALLALVAVLGVSASGPLMAATPAAPLAIAMWRNAGAALATAPFAATSFGWGPRRRPAGRRPSGRIWAGCVLAGVMLAGHFATWVTALKLTSVAAATALVSSQVVWVVIIERLIGRPISLSVVLGITLAVGGVVVITGVDFALSPRAVTGDLLAVAGGVFAALYLLAGQQVRASMSTSLYTTVCYGVCALALTVAALIGGVDLLGLSARAWAMIAAVMVTAQLFGHSLLNYLLAVMSPRLVAILLLLEVPGAALLAGVFLRQAPEWGVYAGLIMIVGGLIVVTLRRRPADPLPAG